MRITIEVVEITTRKDGVFLFAETQSEAYRNGFINIPITGDDGFYVGQLLSVTICEAANNE